MISTICRIDGKDSQDQLIVASEFGSSVLLTIGDNSIEVSIRDLQDAIQNCMHLGESTFVMIEEKPTRHGLKFKRE